MKKIFFIRHAKSDWSVEGLNDIDRPLNQRGYADAHKMGSYLKTILHGQLFFVSSPAIRAISTALIIARETGYPEEKIFIQSLLYESAVNDYEKVLHACDDRFDSVLIFGHNPTISEAIRKFSNSEIEDVPTCSISVLKFETDSWSKALKSSGNLENQFFPKLLAI